MIQKVEQAKLLSFNAVIMNFLYIPFVAFLNTYAEQLLILIMFMGIDFIFGLGKSYTLNLKFTYKRILSGILTKILTLLLPFLLHFFARGTDIYNNQLEEILPYGLSALIVIEFYSILGNFYTVRTGKELEDKDLLSFFVLKLRKFFEAWIKAFKE